MACTVKTKAHFEVLMSPKCHETFSEALINDFSNLVYKTCNVDMAKAMAGMESDRDNIFIAVRNTTGFEEVNKQIIGIMKDWMIHSGKTALNNIPA